MKYFALFILPVLVLSGCNTKNSVQNNLYNNQIYYQNENLTITACEQNIESNEKDITSQCSRIKDISDTLRILIDIGLPIILMNL